MMKETKNAEIDAAEEIYNAGKEHGERMMADAQASIGLERAMGFLDKTRMDDSYNKLLYHLTMFRIREEKLYRPAFKTWDEFCDANGYLKRTVDRYLADLRPLLEEFQDNFSQIFTMPFSKIRYLGKQLGTKVSQIEDGEIVFGDTRIPLKPENKPDIEALIDEMKSSSKKAIDALESELGALRKMNDNKRGQIETLEKRIAKIEARAEEEGYEPGEDVYLDKISKIRTAFHGYGIWIDPENRKTVPEDATPRMKAAYLELLGYMRRTVCAAYDQAVLLYGDPDLDGGWRQPGDDGEDPAGDADVIPLNRR